MVLYFGSNTYATRCRVPVMDSPSQHSATHTSKLAWLFFAGYGVIFALLAIAPFDRIIWFTENLPIMVLMAVVAWLHRHHRFTPMSYAAMSVLVVLIR